MKATAKLLLLVATSLASLISAHAQIETYDTRPAYQGATTTFGDGATIGQTFTNVLAVQSMTYNFFQGSGSASGAITLQATFGQWDDGTASFVAGTTVSLNGGALIDAAADWTLTLANTHGAYPTFEYNFDLSNTALWDDPNTLLNNTTGYATSAGNVYALMLTYSGAETNLALGQTNSVSAFSLGQAYQGTGPGDYYRDFTFYQLNVVPVPTLESSTIASLLAVFLVVGLVAFRIRQQRRQLTLAPAAVA